MDESRGGDEVRVRVRVSTNRRIWSQWLLSLIPYAQ